MWKALIKLVEKWAYRCEHDYELLTENRVLDRSMYNRGIEIPTSTKYVYRCTKCNKFKTLQV